jgi:hypothetical protein
VLLTVRIDSNQRSELVGWAVRILGRQLAKGAGEAG